MEIRFTTRPDLRKLMDISNVWSSRTWSIPSISIRKRQATPIAYCPSSRLRAAFMSGVSAGMSLGALAMYMFDPNKGARRRAVFRDKSIHLMRKSGAAFTTAVDDLGNRTRGMVYATRSRFRTEHVEDDVLVARIRSRIGRVVSNPHGIKVTANEGAVALSGPVRSSELRRLLRAVSGVRGVHHIEHQLELHEHSEGVPGLQGGHVSNRRSWTPSTRLLAGITGGAALAYGASRRDSVGWGLGAVGFGLILRSTSTTRYTREGHRAIQVNKTININAPVGDVYGYWTNVENFPMFMRYVRNVEDRGNGQSHWTVAGPAGVTINWDAEVTQRVENEVISWTSLPGSIVKHTGTVRFRPNQDGSTQVDVRISYEPPAGVLGHAIATMLGRDPKHEMDQDLARMKTMIETGNAPHDAADPLLKQAKEARS